MRMTELLRLIASIAEDMDGDDHNRIAGRVALAKVQASRTLETWHCWHWTSNDINHMANTWFLNVVNCM